MRQVVVVAALIEREGKILLARRAEGKKIAPGLHHLPGGHVEYGEQPAEALRRELDEEFGVSAGVGEPLAAFAYLTGEGVHTVAILYRVVVSGPIKLKTADNVEVVWVRPDEYAGFFPPDDPVFRASRRFLGAAGV